MGNNKTVRHNHLARAPLPLASYEHEIFMGLLACLTADMVEFPQTIRISVKEVTGTDAPNDTQYELIEKACRALFGRAVSLLPPNATRDDVDLVRIVQAIRHRKDTGYIEAMFANKITPYLLELKECQFHLAEQKPAYATTERKQHPGVRALEFFLQPENAHPNTPLMKLKQHVPVSREYDASTSVVFTAIEKGGLYFFEAGLQMMRHLVFLVISKGQCHVVDILFELQDGVEFEVTDVGSVNSKASQGTGVENSSQY